MTGSFIARKSLGDSFFCNAQEPLEGFFLQCVREPAGFLPEVSQPDNLQKERPGKRQGKNCCLQR